MKFHTDILPFLTVLAQSTPVKFDEEFQTFNAVKDKEKIQIEYEKIRHEFAAADIEPVNYYRSQHWIYEDYVRAVSNEGLKDKINRFQ